MSEPKSLEDLAGDIDRLVREYSARAHAANGPAGSGSVTFEPGKTPVPYAGRVFEADEVAAAVRATLEFWLTLGPQGDSFELELASALGAARSILTNSGSSANLLAVSALTSAKLPPERRLRPGDEVITCAAGISDDRRAHRAEWEPCRCSSTTTRLRATPDCTHLEEAFSPARRRPSCWPIRWAIPSTSPPVTAFCRATTSG
jgi:hypothetical protein